ncbi:MAG: class II fructose-bisphosphate aldolase [Minisyncoccia bacterium]|jgi:fructose-bisphosphate aldolase class II
MRNLKQVIEEAEKSRTAIGHFNISNLEQLKAIARAAQKLDLPVIIGVSEGEREYIGIHHVRDLIDSYNKEHGSPSPDGDEGFLLFLNADHTHSLDKVKDAASSGFDEILFDGGKFSIEENILETKRAVKIAKPGLRFWKKNILVEGELGYIGSASEVRKGIPEGVAIRPEDLTKPEDAARFVKATGVDLLAPAVGNIHGMFANAPDPALDIERIRAIKKAVGIPLVLHGASGNTDKDIRAAIDAGVSVVHISTELRAAWRKNLEKDFKKQPDEVAPYKLMPEVIEAMEKLVEEKLRLFSKI